MVATVNIFLGLRQRLFFLNKLFTEARDQFTKTSTLTPWLLFYYFTCRANQLNGQITSPTKGRRAQASSRHILWKMSATLSFASVQTVYFYSLLKQMHGNPGPVFVSLLCSLPKLPLCWWKEKVEDLPKPRTGRSAFAGMRHGSRANWMPGRVKESVTNRSMILYD